MYRTTFSALTDRMCIFCKDFAINYNAGHYLCLLACLFQGGERGEEGGEEGRGGGEGSQAQGEKGERDAATDAEEQEGEEEEEDKEMDEEEGEEEEEGGRGYYLRKRRPVVYQYQPIIQVSISICIIHSESIEGNVAVCMHNVG